MTVSFKRLRVGAGVEYLLTDIAAGDSGRSLLAPLTDYYAESGYPPGVWRSRAVRLVGLVVGDVVSEEQLRRLLGEGRDPVTGEQLGQAFRVYKTVAERVAARVAQLDKEIAAAGGLRPDSTGPAGPPGPDQRPRQPDNDRQPDGGERHDDGERKRGGGGRGKRGVPVTAAEREAAVAVIEAEEAAREVRRAVAGFDYTFSPSKSVSVLWALADARTQAVIFEAHQAAVDAVVAMIDRDVAATRTGAVGPDGAVAQVEVAGVLAASFDHWDSRAGDPQLHTHLVVSNKVQTQLDGKWRALDGRPMHAATVALSEHYDAVLADELTRRLGVRWEQRQRGRDRNPAWHITGVPDELIDLFSTRSHDIEAETDRLIEAYITAHGHRPSKRTVIKLRQIATLATREPKNVVPLAELMKLWRRLAAVVLGRDPRAWAAEVIANAPAPLPLLRAGDIPAHLLATLGGSVVDAVSEKRSVWRHWNLHAEASRQTMHWRFATTTDRETIVERIVETAEHASVRLTPPELASSPPEFQRPDGSSVLRPRHSAVFTSREVLAAEDRLLTRSRTVGAPTLPDVLVAHVASRPGPDGHRLGDDQAAALTAVAVSGRQVDVLVGPAGAGKTTAMNALRRAWEARHGPGSVVGLAPSAAAAEVLADDLGIGTENTAKWLHDHGRGLARFSAGQLVIIDEASLAGTLTLDLITGHAAQVGAKVLLVGDWAQLGAVDAGGAFGLLARDRGGNAPELSDVRRFRHQWERDASLKLRAGDTTVLDTYAEHGRVRDGGTEAMTDDAYQAWRTDIGAGRTSLMIAHSTSTVTALNTRARADRITTGHVAATGAVRLHDGTTASAGDLIITRRNDRHLVCGRRWARNGDRWTITAAHPDGSVTARPAGLRSGPTLRLPADYVAGHVELGYAVTVHRAQGATTDTAHVVVAPSMTREVFYVAMTRGRHANTAYVPTDQPDLEAHQRHPDDHDATGLTVLTGVLARVGTEQSAHDTVRAEHDRWSGIDQLAAEYDTIATAAQYHRWTALLHRCPLTAAQVDEVTGSDAFGALCAELRRAEALHHHPETLLPRLVAARSLADADDIAAVLHHRTALATRTPPRPRRHRPVRLIAGLLPPAGGLMTSAMRQALNERERLIEQRARTLARTAVTDREHWAQRLGPPPPDRARRTAWEHHAATVAAYRDRYGITSDQPLGGPPANTAQQDDQARARTALTAARQLARPADRPAPRRPGPDLSL